MADIDLSFIEDYKTDVLEILQRMQPKYQGLARQPSLIGSKMYWQRYGVLTTQTKARRARLVAEVMDHTRVEMDAVDAYCYTEIDDLDMLKQNVDERRAHARAHIFAMNREKDDYALQQWIAGANATDAGPGDAVSLTLDDLLGLAEVFNQNHVPDDGGRYCAVSPKTWSQLMHFNEFANADYIGSSDLPFNGATAKRWIGIMWFTQSTYNTTDTPEQDKGGLPYDPATGVATNLAWHRDYVGFGEAKAPTVTWDWENDLQGYSCGSRMSIGANVIEADAVYKFSVDEAVAPTPNN